MECTTRIDDLPENITMRMPNDQAPTYAPINVHPNPYGNSLQPNVIPLPQSKPDSKVRFQEETPQMRLPSRDNHMDQTMYKQENPQMRLPSRDIPMDQSMYQQDEEVQPNYIPRTKLTSDYVKDYEEVTHENIRRHENRKDKTSMVDKIFTDLQTPILIALMFFIFQMPLMNTMFYRNFSFLSVYNSDGNINFYGITLKSVLFGSIFYSMQNAVQYLTDI